MKKIFFVLTAMVASSAWAQQNVDITAEQFNSGAANAELTTLGRQAAASGKRLVVTAPQHWHAQISARILAGGQADIVLRDGFYETLLVRVEDKAPEPVKPEPAPVAIAAKPAPAPVAIAAKPAPAPVAIAAKPTPAPEPEPVPVPEPPKVEQAPSQPVVEAPALAPAVAPIVQAPPAVPEAAPAVVAEDTVPASVPSAVGDPGAPTVLVAAEPSDIDPVRESMEKSYNNGKRIIERVTSSYLREGDIIYTGTDAAVVVRRDNSRLIRMWLVGPLNLNQAGLRSDGLNKYHVLDGNLTTR